MEMETWREMNTFGFRHRLMRIGFNRKRRLIQCDIHFNNSYHDKDSELTDSDFGTCFNSFRMTPDFARKFGKTLIECADKADPVKVDK
jgi:hypothetical protein